MKIEGNDRVEGQQKHPTADLRLTLVDADWIASICGCSRRLIHRLRDLGQLPKPIKLGRLSKWRRSDIEQWIAEGCTIAR